MSIDLTKPLQTRDGRSVRILCTDAHCTSGGAPQPIVGIVTGHHSPMAWCVDGRYYGDEDSSPSDCDLFNVPPPKRTVKVEVRLYRANRIGSNLGVVALIDDERMNFGPAKPLAATTVELEYEDQP